MLYILLKTWGVLLQRNIWDDKIAFTNILCFFITFQAQPLPQAQVYLSSFRKYNILDPEIFSETLLGHWKRIFVISNDN